jgi:hypothetical protein
MDRCSIRSETSSKSGSGSGGANEGRRLIWGGGLVVKLWMLRELRVLAFGFGDAAADEIEFTRDIPGAGEDGDRTDATGTATRGGLEDGEAG